MKRSYARKLFGSAAIFNWLAGLPIVIAGRQVSILFGMPPPETLLFTQIAGMAIVLFGIGYWLESLSPGEHRSAVVLGLIGKICVFVLAIGHVVIGDLNGIFPTLACVDLSYAYLFWRYLGRAQPGH